MKRIGLDIGSTTIKCIVMDEEGNILFDSYRRHFSKISENAGNTLNEIADNFPNEEMLLSVSGSAGMGIATDLNLPFAQEVYATRTAVNRRLPGTDVVIELGGEDAKILFLTDGVEVRMNGSCAGGTGAFIDQMATLMNVSPDELDQLAADYSKIYTIASRCGVFAKSDIQPLINQGARKEDIAASILRAVVNQTISGLAQGREIKGNILYLGGPLTFFPQLRIAFDKVLGCEGACPNESLYFVAMGAAYSKDSVVVNPRELSKKAEGYSATGGYVSCPCLFKDEKDYADFITRHENDSANIKSINAPEGRMYLGIDAGSTTIKALLCDENGNIFNTLYCSNSGNPVPIVKDYLDNLYEKYPEINIVSAAVTGYGEDIIRNAFRLDKGIVETVAHYTAAKKFLPDVDFIIDIGGQDIKCFKIRNGTIDSLFLNEACSSGCGSFLQTFAGVLGYDMDKFSEMALYAERPVDLGSRCTVFMNSSVKQAQKDGAGIENIAAGLCISVVKNALYKVIRCASPDQLGKNIVVQGGTFLNNAVLRAFEQEIGCNVIRPHISGLMGAYGAALYAQEKAKNQQKSSLLTAEELKNFTHTVKATSCNGCSNHCRLTINTFDGGRSFIAGNRCDRPLKSSKNKVDYNLYAYKYGLLDKLRHDEIDTSKPTVGIPMGLNMYELLPFWYAAFKSLGFNVVVSGESTHKLYVKGQSTIPSDTVCYPAKLLHGHIEDLIEKQVDAVFYPCMSYNVDESLGHNHYNCPVVAYYPKVIAANVKALAKTDFIGEFIGIHDRKEFAPHFGKILAAHGYVFSAAQLKAAAKAAYTAYDEHMAAVRKKGDEYLDLAKKEGLPVIILAGRPYHVDPEINHGIDRLICELGAVVITEDSVSNKQKRFPTTVLNQWTYHSRLYAAAKFVTENEDLNLSLVQLVSFGCGLDAVTTDEARSILESKNKLYTQIKIDEITNLGAVKIRLRSLFAMLNGGK